MGLIFDTSELIAAEKSRRSLLDVLSSYPPTEELGVSVVTVAELQHGVRRAQTSEQLTARQRMMADALSIFIVHDLTATIALRLGTLDTELAMQGQRTDFADLAIAATTIHLNFSLVTSNIRHFGRIPGLRILQMPKP
jgi:tRNA(fMet)-specific endonuclease VapC